MMRMCENDGGKKTRNNNNQRCIVHNTLND